jgi:hypothetical protein
VARIVVPVRALRLGAAVRNTGIVVVMSSIVGFLGDVRLLGASAVGFEARECVLE